MNKKDLELNRKEYYDATKVIYKRIYDYIKRKKIKDKKNGIYDLVTILDTFTEKEYQIHVGINFSDKMRKKITNRIRERILWGK